MIQEGQGIGSAARSCSCDRQPLCQPQIDLCSSAGFNPTAVRDTNLDRAELAAFLGTEVRLKLLPPFHLLPSILHSRAAPPPQQCQDVALACQRPRLLRAVAQLDASSRRCTSCPGTLAHPSDRRVAQGSCPGLPIACIGSSSSALSGQGQGVTRLQRVVFGHIVS